MKEPAPILLIEDDLVDQMRVRRALRDLNLATPLVVARDGVEAWAYLKDPQEARPFLIILDIQMPRMNGLEFLQRLAQDDRLGTIPVVVLTSSAEPQDIRACFRLKASGYMIKSIDYKEFVQIIKTVHAYWSLSKRPEPE
jgi:CheY-like chemotaxis protein